MILKSFLLLILPVFSLGQYTQTNSDYLFNLTQVLPVLNTVNLFDGPSNVTFAQTTPTTNRKPTMDNIFYYNYYAASMYCPWQLEDLSCEYCQEFRKDINTYAIFNNDTCNTCGLVSVSHSRKEITVTYRGSMNVMNFLLDLVTVTVDSTDLIKIHRGFYIATMSLYNRVVEAVGYQRSLHPDYKIVIVGHSLGAAMAVLTTYFLLSLNQFPGATYEVYGFGQPRIGNKYFADYMNSQNITIVRVCSNADIVCHLPPVSALGTTLISDHYYHLQTECWSRSSNNQRFCDDSTYEDPTCSDSLGPTYSAADHIYYLNVDYFTCYVGQSMEFLALPVGGIDPVDVLPMLPQPIYNYTTGAIDFVVNLLGPILGR